jgi:hypothetical protein
MLLYGQAEHVRHDMAPIYPGVHMNTPGKPKPTSRQGRYLIIAFAVILVILFITLFAPW